MNTPVNRQPLLSLQAVGYKRSVLIVLGTLGCVIGFFVSLDYYTEWSSRRKYAREIDHAFNDVLLPEAKFIESFQEREHRFPTVEEIYQAGFMGRSGSYITEGVPDRAFIISTEVPGAPEWIVEYHSWDNKRLEYEWP